MQPINQVLKSALPTYSAAVEREPSEGSESRHSSTSLTIRIPTSGILSQTSEFIAGSNMILMNYGRTPEQVGKIEMLADILEDDGWTPEQFKRRTMAFIKANKYPTWTIADFIGCEEGRAKIRFMSYGEVLATGNTRFTGLDGYRINGKVMYCPHTEQAIDGLQRVIANGEHIHVTETPKPSQAPKPTPAPKPETIAKALEEAELRAKIAEQAEALEEQRRSNYNLYNSLKEQANTIAELREELKYKEVNNA